MAGQQWLFKVRGTLYCVPCICIPVPGTVTSNPAEPEAAGAGSP